ncbi:MAG TPA: hypothetical protein VNO83_04615 [Pseudonocardia sp.]|nr:hypothetical protein [Pseudonocardia sp.]
MSGTLITLGLMLLCALAVVLGMLIAGERQHRERERLSSRSWELYLWEQELMNIAELQDCPSCQLLRRRAELHRHPLDP